ncbi:MAG: hypothetical protein Q4D61_08155, partial [Cardiobacteriaceae bacterium]|nr:hypothetical protein [Cardiobacteriaceae bacterium]
SLLCLKFVAYKSELSTRPTGARRFCWAEAHPTKTALTTNLQSLRDTAWARVPTSKRFAFCVGARGYAHPRFKIYAEKNRVGRGFFMVVVIRAAIRT